MALTIKNTEVERLAAALSAMTGETKTEAIRRALEERCNRLTAERDEQIERKVEEYIAFLEREIWPHVKPERLGRPMSRQEEAEALGYDTEYGRMLGYGEDEE
jgi:antitoxin VapB